MLKVDKDLVVVGEYRSGYYSTQGYEKIKRSYFDSATNLDIKYIDNGKGELIEDPDEYNELSIQDINRDVQQVLVGDEILEHLTDTEPENGCWTCIVRINGGFDYVKIPDFLITNE